MDEGNNLFNAVGSEPDNVNSAVDNSGSENEVIQDANVVSADTPSERSEHSVADPELTDEESEEKPSSTVIQVTDDDSSDTGYIVNELNVVGLNEFIERENALLTVAPTSNDYYTFISGEFLEYFADYMSLYPLNDYKACHLRHYVGSSSYQTQYDDYYYLWFNYPEETALEIHKPYNVSQYEINVVTQRDLNATIVYGSAQGQADLRKGVSYVQEMGLLCALGVVLVLYILSAFFKHLAR